ncbi:predicted protein [Chaetoceros tenuissimus]|uniref:Uncharacterized protein n=1 Tax=Chaetoceros tenuissimus TaxID=426638 RepID=A0AAD3DEY3_9STRA|nr:predicted protein [Chaetoceros tenuissimus]
MTTPFVARRRNAVYYSKSSSCLPNPKLSDSRRNCSFGSSRSIQRRNATCSSSTDTVKSSNKVKNVYSNAIHMSNPSDLQVIFDVNGQPMLGYKGTINMVERIQAYTVSRDFSNWNISPTHRSILVNSILDDLLSQNFTFNERVDAGLFNPLSERQAFRRINRALKSFEQPSKKTVRRSSFARSA